MGARESTTRDEVEIRGDLIRRLHLLDRTGDTIRFQYGKPRRGSRTGDRYDTIIVFQGGKRSRTSEFYDDRDFMYYTVFRCVEEWTLVAGLSAGRTDGSPRHLHATGRTNSGMNLIKKISGSSTPGREIDKESSPRVDGYSRVDSSPRLIKISSQADLLRDSRAAKNYAKIAELRVKSRGYVDETSYKSPNKEEILALVKQLVAELVTGGNVPNFLMKLGAYDMGLVPPSSFPYYLNFRSNAHSPLSAQLMYHLQWYRSILGVSPVLDIRLSIVDLTGIRTEPGSPYLPLDMRTDDINTPNWHCIGLLQLQPTLLQDLFTFETVLMCLSPGIRSELIFPEGTVLCKDTSQTLDKILAENPVLKARVKALRKM